MNYDYELAKITKLLEKISGHLQAISIFMGFILSIAGFFILKAIFG
jgi:hypothetical protein